jgi:hypothetical protein
MWNQQLQNYYTNLQVPEIPNAYEVMNPYQYRKTMDVVKAFLDRYYNDSYPRHILFGINPGRFGSGVTGISFTDPIQLEHALGIPNDFDKRPELSSTFIYEVIHAYGGPEAFYSRFFISAVYPLGFLQDGININYYDLKNWRDYMIDHIINEINKQLEMNVHRDVAVCIGKGENYKILKALNESHHWFEKIEALPHPRWILQYRSSAKLQHVDAYLKLLNAIAQ